LSVKTIFAGVFIPSNQVNETAPVLCQGRFLS
jgi:hypothetical protein